MFRLGEPIDGHRIGQAVEPRRRADGPHPARMSGIGWRYGELDGDVGDHGVGLRDGRTQRALGCHLAVVQPRVAGSVTGGEVGTVAGGVHREQRLGRPDRRQCRHRTPGHRAHCCGGGRRRGRQRRRDQRQPPSGRSRWSGGGRRTHRDQALLAVCSPSKVNVAVASQTLGDAGRGQRQGHVDAQDLVGAGRQHPVATVGAGAGSPNTGVEATVPRGPGVEHCRRRRSRRRSRWSPSVRP